MHDVMANVFLLLAITMVILQAATVRALRVRDEIKAEQKMADEFFDGFPGYASTGEEERKARNTVEVEDMFVPYLAKQPEGLTITDMSKMKYAVVSGSNGFDGTYKIGKPEPVVVTLDDIAWDGCIYEASVAKALSNEQQVSILSVLLEDDPKELTPTEIAERTNIVPGNVSKHLASLREAGLVEFRKEGAKRLYSVDDKPLAKYVRWLGEFIGSSEGGK